MQEESVEETLVILRGQLFGMMSAFSLSVAFLAGKTNIDVRELVGSIRESAEFHMGPDDEEDMPGISPEERALFYRGIRDSMNFFATFIDPEE